MGYHLSRITTANDGAYYSATHDGAHYAQQTRL